MKITRIEIDGFGVWSQLREEFEPGLNVLYGPNEAGKTTLLAFLRSLLYGFSTERRRRYLPPLAGGRAGGSLWLQTADGEYQLSRHDDDEQGTTGQARLVGPEGSEAPPERLAELLGGLDERTFNNVFAVGLREIQELGTLDESAAAQWLYDLTTGLDRVSLGEVMRELGASRQRIIAPGGSQIGRLLERRRRLTEQAAELGQQTRRYAELAGQRNRLETELVERESQAAALKAEIELTEVAVAVRDRWHERAEIDQQIAAAGDVRALPREALARWEALDRQLRVRRRRVRRIRSARRNLRELAGELPRHAALERQAGRIHALADQQEWIVGLEKQAGELSGEVAALEVQVERQRANLGLDEDLGSDVLAKLSARRLARLKPLAQEVRASRRALAEARSAIEHGEETSEALGRQIETALAEQPECDLMAAVERAGERVSQLRRRVQLDERIEELKAHEVELEEQTRKLVDRQLLPLSVVVALGAVFALGVTLILAGWWLSFGWTMALLGVAGIGGSALMKFHLERSAERQLAACEKQLAMVRGQRAQAKEERRELDAELPRGAGPLYSRLEAAEQELARLEELLPVDAERKHAAQDAASAQRRLEEAQSAQRQARRRWRQALRAAGWPEKLSPKQLWRLAGGCRQLRELYGRLERCREAERQVADALEMVRQRIGELLTEIGAEPSSHRAAEQLRLLRGKLAEYEASQRKRDELKTEDRRLRRRQTRDMRRLRRAVRRRNLLLRQAGAADEVEFRARAVAHARLVELRQRRALVERELTAALGEKFSEEAVRRQMESVGGSGCTLEEHWEQLAAEQERCQAAVREALEVRGRLGEQLGLLAADRRLLEVRLELAEVETALERAVEGWQVLAVTSLVLESVRGVYERQRQPQTLREASEYLRRLTGDRYGRVWTPMDEEVLYVDDAQGERLPIDVLSRGTREQLFLSLRLALAGCYARRGMELPLVLDDVLVNFDAPRAKAAATLLRDFARSGQQLLVFTCHEHIARLFKSLKVPVRTLPARQVDEDHAERPKRKPPARRSSSRPLAPAARKTGRQAIDETPPETQNAQPIALQPEPLEVWAAAPRLPAVPLVLASRIASTDEAGAVREDRPPAEALEAAAPIAQRSGEEPDADDRDDQVRGSLPAASRWSAEGAEEFAGELKERVFVPPSKNPEGVF